MPGKTPHKDAHHSRIPGLHDYEGMRRTAAKYVFAAKFVPGTVCLDLACGSGYGSAYLARSGARMVVGGDMSPTGIQYARMRYLQDGSHFLLLDAHHLPFIDCSFDLVVSIETIEHLESPPGFLLECRRVLRENGCLLLTTPNKRMASPYTASPIDRDHSHEFQPEELCSLTNEYFSEVLLYGQFYRRDVGWRFDTLAATFVSPLIRSMPGGEAILSGFRHFVVRSPSIRLEDLSQLMSEGAIEDDVLPFPQQGKEIGSIVLVARK